ncbi:precorrin-3B C(17)-methyltransferase [Desulfurivibrio dismutans]|uniref:precorrin-3B C(17)-methyltransferase n=1 Tax=Desulfurivibrio dismutans TaxID=1398908 RepID=UPI0023DA36D1|nr:precorrin-3B C(17)-methyltransferase [Desulfurivibrio alkaliphilus]MDF1613348.1 precorrin-3B C(17)-methyltransferase [Desulfurivibrio alkaliphilus]
MAQRDSGPGPGKIYLVGTGPGGPEHLTGAAIAALNDADCIVGYRTYLELIPDLLAGKEVISSEMMKEVERCRRALELAEEGRTVALVSGGDPGIYAMAGLVFELAGAEDGRRRTDDREGANEPLLTGRGGVNEDEISAGDAQNQLHAKARTGRGKDRGNINIEVIPGIAALNACAARLGAPLMHDFAAVSLSDLLTPWETIAKRLQAVAAADFVTVIYNPRSKRRTEQIVKAREIFLEHRDPQTPVGIVTAATRPEEKIILTTLAEMPFADIGMQSTVIIGNAQSYTWNELLITPRGYGSKYNLQPAA